MKLRTIAMGMGGILLAASCTNDVVEEVNMGQEISFTTRMTRANAVDNVDALKQFRVFAKAEGYTQMFIDGEVAKQGIVSEGKRIFSMDHAYHWPTGTNSIQFWAYAPTDPTKSKDNDIIKFSLTSSGAPNITDFTPASYTAAAASDPVNSHNSGVSHEDLLLAYTKAQRANGTSAISLNFEHALSQIEVRATIGGDKNTQLTGNKYDVKVKGVWIANVKSSGNVTFDENKNNKLSWSVGSSKVVYGYEFDTPVSLDHTNSGLLVNNDNAKSSLMLVPQKLDIWDISKDNNTKEKNPDDGAYILLLCRVEATHPGAEHSGNNRDLVLGGESTHIHQMFPVKDGESTFNDKLYGYVCVPVSTEWLPGKKYIYNLEFCGLESGAGIYPPENDMTDLKLPDGNGDYEYVKTIPADSGKKPGDPVLTDPIKFSVSVSPWDEAWKDGNEGDIPMK